MAVAVIYHGFLIALVNVTPFHSVKVNCDEGIENLVCSTATFYSTMAIVSVVDEKGSVVLPRAHVSLRDVMRNLHCHIVIEWMENYDLIQSQSLFSHFVKHLTTKEKEYLLVVILSFESISPENFISLIIKLWEDNVPLAIS